MGLSVCFAIVCFDHILEGFKACATIGLLTARAGAIDARHLAATAVFEVVFDFFVTKWMAKAHHHG